MQGPDAGQTLDALIRFLSITVIDLALSGDNAIVIGMAAASLERRQRRWAILGGATLAIVLRVVLTTVASVLLFIPMLSAVGGALLFWVAWKLLRMDTEAEGADPADHGRDMSRLRNAILVIVVADVTMSLDNVIAVAGSAHGSAPLIVLGLLISMPLLMVTGGVISLIIDRFKGLIYLGAGVICFTGIRMILEDRLVEPQLALDPLLLTAIAAAGGVALLAVFLVAGRQLPARVVPVSAEDVDRSSSAPHRAARSARDRRRASRSTGREGDRSRTPSRRREGGRRPATLRYTRPVLEAPRGRAREGGSNGCARKARRPPRETDTHLRPRLSPPRRRAIPGGVYP